MANVHADFMQVAEKMVGLSKSQGEYPTLSAISSLLFSVSACCFENLPGFDTLDLIGASD
jgi:hypothetical protein